MCIYRSPLLCEKGESVRYSPSRASMLKKPKSFGFRLLTDLSLTIYRHININLLEQEQLQKIQTKGTKWRNIHTIYNTKGTDSGYGYGYLFCAITVMSGFAKLFILVLGSVGHVASTIEWHAHLKDSVKMYVYLGAFLSM